MIWQRSRGSNPSMSPFARESASRLVTFIDGRFDGVLLEKASKFSPYCATGKSSWSSVWSALCHFLCCLSTSTRPVHVCGGHHERQPLREYPRPALSYSSLLPCISSSSAIARSVRPFFKALTKDFVIFFHFESLIVSLVHFS